MKRSGRIPILFALFTALGIVVFLIDLSVGSINLSIGEVVNSLTGGEVSESVKKIVIDLRLCRALTAIAVGLALSVSGLQMQTIFRNPLAGPYVLGISSGASLAVALFIIGAPAIGASMPPQWYSVGIAGAAWIGAAAVLLIILMVSRRMKDIMVVLILGIMISAGVSAIVQILQYFSDENSLKSYVVWTMGSLSGVTIQQLPLIWGAIAGGLILAAASVKSLNMLLLGDEYAMTMGVNLRRTRIILFASTTLLAGTVTAFCGPIGFIGLAMPHLARMIFSTADHRVLIAASGLTGIIVIIGCDIVSKMYTLPINSVAALVGIPVIIWIVIKNR